MKQRKTKPMEKPSALLLEWYDKNKRVLPWRATDQAPNAYGVWLSEIMLQQTTVATVGPYFKKFLARWPDLESLAAAKLDDVLKEWAGLGYYRRAHLLHKCACVIAADYGGRFPRSEAELLSLPGFGLYTAAAVASIAFNRKANVIDGNVERVISRVRAITTPLPQAKALIREAAAKLLPGHRFGDYAQALMDLGATICTPRKPRCLICPWREICQARALNIAEALPKREKKKARPERYTTAFFVTNAAGDVLLRKRPMQGLLPGMDEVPTSKWRDTQEVGTNDPLAEAPMPLHWQILDGEVRHVFTHFALNVRVAKARFKRGNDLKTGRWVALDHLGSEALPSLMRKIVHHAQKA